MRHSTGDETEITRHLGDARAYFEASLEALLFLAVDPRVAASMPTPRTSPTMGNWAKVAFMRACR